LGGEECKQDLPLLLIYVTAPTPNSTLKFVAITSGTSIFLTLFRFTIPYLSRVLRVLERFDFALPVRVSSSANDCG